MSNYLYEFDGKRPKIHSSAYVHESAVVIGDVAIGAACYVGPNATLRGDNGSINLLEFANVQDGCVVHVSPGGTTLLQSFAQLGHGVIVHGATIGFNTIIGMNSTVLDFAVVSEGCIVAANSLIKIREVTKPASLYAGTPAAWIKDLTQDVIARNLAAAKKYVAYAQTYPTLQKKVSRSSCEVSDGESVDRRVSNSRSFYRRASDILRRSSDATAKSTAHLREYQLQPDSIRQLASDRTKRTVDSEQAQP